MDSFIVNRLVKYPPKSSISPIFSTPPQLSTSTIVLSVLPVVRFMLYVDPRSRRSAALSNENKKLKVSRQNTQTQKKE